MPGFRWPPVDHRLGGLIKTKPYNRAHPVYQYPRFSFDPGPVFLLKRLTVLHQELQQSLRVWVFDGHSLYGIPVGVDRNGC